MVDLPRFLQVPSRATKARAFVASQMNFYRVHLIAFTIVSSSHLMSTHCIDIFRYHLCAQRSSGV